MIKLKKIDLKKIKGNVYTPLAYFKNENRTKIALDWLDTLVKGLLK